MTDDDAITVDMGFDDARRRVHGCVNYRARINGRWVEVGRYDNAHGVPHVHRFYPSGDVVRSLRQLSVPEMVERGKHDFLKHWLRHRRRWEVDAS